MNSIHFGLVLLFVFFVSCKDPQLIMVNELFRHGARYPVYPKKDDGSAQYTYAEHSFGELTTNGKKMHYVLGQQLYKQYWNKLFTDNTYNQSRFYVKSTDVNRTIESAQSQLMGILEQVEALRIVSEEQANYSKPQWVPDYSQDLIPVTPGISIFYEGPVFPEAVKYHPMVIHVEKVGTNAFSSGDFLRTYSPENCPNQKKWIEANEGDSKYDYITSNENFTRAIQNLSAVLGRNITFWQAPAYYDNFECATYMGRGDKYILSTFKNETLARSLYYVYTLQMYISLYSNQKQIRATATGFFNETINNIKKRIHNKDEVRWNIYSAHDTTVGNMLAALNLTNPECIYKGFLSKNDSNTDTCITQYPKYTSNLIFQIWEYNSSYHTFKIRYNGQVRNISFCNWATECPVETLYAWYQQFKDENYLQTCGVFNTDVQTYFSVAAAEFMIILVLAIAGLISCLKNNLNKQKQSPAKKVQPKSAKEALNDSLLSEQGKQTLKEN